ncbi:MAG: hypothetical protein C7B45_07930 [Sulfobacillus acidophilus]|uniref:Uncharacterized protein n=1 Tax=Sulfobacillus acidophilus TaxID=53633 RepID=A0A2T2WIS9_9FIRM|nr:MAG: hypothetical protein C7B45_07930 [Sulfobacillus acidophilus]
MKTYHGGRTATEPSVWVEQGTTRHPLPHVGNHSPTGFNWGYGGSGPADLALSLLVNALGHRRQADTGPLYQEFKWAVVAHLPDEWSLTPQDILDWVRQQQELSL